MGVLCSNHTWCLLALCALSVLQFVRDIRFELVYCNVDQNVLCTGVMKLLNITERLEIPTVFLFAI